MNARRHPPSFVALTFWMVTVWTATTATAASGAFAQNPATGDWNTILDRMATLGAAMTAAERQTLIEFLNGRDS